MTVGRSWIVTADNRRAALFVCRHTPSGTLHVDQIHTIENAHEGEHEHHRPCFLGRGASANASTGHEDQEEHLGFVREVSDWLGAAASGSDVDPAQTTVFASSRFLGMLREHIGPLGFTLRVGELTSLRAAQLAVHPAILEAVHAHPWPS